MYALYIIFSSFHIWDTGNTCLYRQNFKIQINKQKKGIKITYYTTFQRKVLLT